MFLLRIYLRKCEGDRIKANLIFVTFKLCNEYSYMRGEQMMSMAKLVEILRKIGYSEYCFEREKSLP